MSQPVATNHIRNFSDNAIPSKQDAIPSKQDAIQPSQANEQAAKTKASD